MDYFLVNKHGMCEEIEVSEIDLSDSPYRLYRFLTDLEDLLSKVSSDRDRLHAIVPLVQRLLTSSYWLQIPDDPPNPELGWSVQMLYDEPFFPLTVQLVTWLPGTKSTIHNHAAWGIVAMVNGQEKNTFWKRSPSPKFPNKIERVSDRTIGAGEIITFLPDAIHSIEAMGDEPTISFNIYGETDYDRRFEFDLDTKTAEQF
jgi:predicted metal-dependent enzyme (double-stranded beta helix superfamily)